MREKWIKDRLFPKYQVSNYGRVKSFNDYHTSGSGRFVKSWKVPNGYLVVQLCDGSKRRRVVQVGRLVLENFYSKKNMDKLECNHKDTNKLNNHLSNLEWVTASDNIKHSYASGARKPNHGEKCNFSKLTEADILAIRELASNGVSNKEIAETYKTAPTNISKIVLRKRWKHI